MTQLSAAARWEHRIFILTLIGKAALGTAQLLIAAGIWAGIAARLPGIVERMFAAETARDPTDFLARHLIRLAELIRASDLSFYLLYFAYHGVLHLAVAAALLYGAMWAYPAGILTLAAFCVIQTVEWLHEGGFILPLLTLIDLAVIWMTWVEWQRKRRAQAA
ncbi:DUF2127 domain-containing protein [Rhodobacterales bacterium HKCCE2091]|nr:DUF2127 domain-containing protein [Rhodobacterales bacterium HKCCE2091]